MKRSLALVLLLLTGGCDSGLAERPAVDGAIMDDAGSFEGDGGSSASDAAARPDAGDGPDAGAPLPAPAACTYLSETHAAAMVELDTGPGSSERLRFVIRGVPSPSLITRAVLRFDSYDADHPGEEGVVEVNMAAPRDLPADVAWDNANGTGELDVLADLVEGDNLVTFGPGTLPRSFYRIGAVRLDVDARVETCIAPPPPPDPSAVERSVHYRDATYTNRRTWVIRCDDYAFTASGDEHLATDCDGGYRPGGDRRGTATFHFGAVADADYEVIVRSRHTENRNPAGALFVVAGVGRRISQRSDRGHTDDLWGTARLSGDVDVVLDSSMEGQSDSVISVRLVPVR